MADSDLYPNAGDDFDTAYYPEPALTTEQKEAEQQAAAVQATSYPIMEDVAKWFDERIAECDSRRNITAYATTHNVDNLEDLGRAFDIVRELLEIKRREWGDFNG